jgi:hypothetical protein
MECGYAMILEVCYCWIINDVCVLCSSVQTKPRMKKRRDEDSDQEDDTLPTELTGKIMREAHLQQEEIKRDGDKAHTSVYKESLEGAIQNLKQSRADESDEEAWSEPESDYNPDDWEAEMNEEDEAVLAAFMNRDGSNQKQKTLADIIMEKIQEKESGGSKNVRYVMLIMQLMQPLCTTPSCTC